MGVIMVSRAIASSPSWPRGLHPGSANPQGSTGRMHILALGVESQTHKDAKSSRQQSLRPAGAHLPFRGPSPTRQAVTMYRSARFFKEPHSLTQPLPCREWMTQAPPRAARWTARTQRRSSGRSLSWRMSWTSRTTVSQKVQESQTSSCLC